ncbi:2-C-methyl-D-erythritol 4-phosphate cytidylyltransferase [Vespertiliibacter pulmonis]|uniref:2-C-methyl-D-erythritol 4-phosphate cytidylyltransferase n=1 Tax=Vespertiliibacter pulmonis TaxID=1443036 RepID=A0A3N4VS57_9PAST|nr:2-C-methyl-D-erythritol 4-phosphate cytidylyltransferase [Vespertiliibacter pulmonis]QLB21515.1 2-C-methyl-D-erythritol 4-phosphate cytidylyltransferase [Vespertiliibacter pulmonis]RPE85932.1 2-C-methyl-D-erythritol 4-phosphate cytidylyltransferase [Vespertiliibacter pulmonis]
MNRRIVAIIPASGVGSRMGANCPKQYLRINNKTILEHTLTPFLTHSTIEKIVVVVSETDPYYQQLPIIDHPKIKWVFGGETRANSVLNGLKTLKYGDWALVHDAARPCLKRSDLDKLLQIENEQGAILATPVVDTIKRSFNHHTIAHTEDRSTLWQAQTPQFFPAQILANALESALAKNIAITDEASAMEFAGYHPQLISGRSDNLKITRPEDLALAEFYLLKAIQDEGK